MVSAALLFAPLAIAAPPEPAPAPIEPSSVVDEPATAIEPAPVVEPAPTEPAPTEPAPTPTVVEPAPSEPALPTWDSKLPSYDAPLLAPDPHSQSGRSSSRLDGNGITVIGSLLLGGGVVLGASSGVLMVADSDEVGLWIAGATLSAAAVATGIALVVAGTKKRKQYKPWRRQHNAPPQGNGMFAGGTFLISASAFGVLLGTVSLSLQTNDDLPYGQVALSLSGIAAVTGIALVVVGSVRGKRFDAWHKAQLSPSFGLLRTPQLQTAGATFGVAGRF